MAKMSLLEYRRQRYEGLINLLVFVHKIVRVEP